MTTLSDLIYSGKHLHRSSAFALIRSRARTVLRKYKQICQRCDYSVHVEVCHIKPVTSFSLHDDVEKCNSEENLLLLCRNCHWELDKLGMFTSDEVSPRVLDEEKIEKRKLKRRTEEHRIKEAYYSSDKLHREVWNIPRTRLAKRLGVSDPAVNKLCRRRNIPTPPRGFWRKVETNKLEGQTCPLPMYG